MSDEKTPLKQTSGSREMLRRTGSAYLLLATCASVAVSPLFGTGIPQGHDLTLEFPRVAEYTHLLKAGIFPVRWGTDLSCGYGYPIYDFFPPLFMLISGIFAIAAGLSVLSAIKLAVLLLTLAGGIGMYWFAGEHFEKKGGLLAACLYVLAPYHFIDLFNRSAFSEFTALSVAPFVFYGLARVAKEDESRLGTAIVLAAGSSLFVLSHNLSVAMYAPLFLVYFMTMIAADGQWKKTGRLVLPLMLAFTLTAFYTLPLLAEIRFVQTWMLTAGKFDVLKNLLPIGDVTAWMTILSWLLAALSVAATIICRRNIPRPTFAVLCVFGILLPLMVFMTTPASRPVWSQAGFLEWLQFPWRLLSPATFLICFAAGALSYTPLPKNVLLYGGIALGAITLIAFSMVNGRPYASVTDGELAPARIREYCLPTTALSEYLPVWVKDTPPVQVGNRLTASHVDAGISMIEESPHRHAYKIASPGETLLTAHLFYFPGWKLYVNGNEVQPRITDQGLMQFHLPKGQSVVELKFEDTPVRTLGNVLSILGLMLLGILMFLAIRPVRR